jgi:hypothetical protein
MHSGALPHDSPASNLVMVLARKHLTQWRLLPGCCCCGVLQAQLSNALASLDSATASVAEQQEIINNLQVEGTGAQDSATPFSG